MLLRFSLVLFGAQLAAAPGSKLSLDDAIRAAWTNDPTTAALALAPQLSRAREVQAGLAPKPGLELRGAVPVKGDSEWSMGVGISRLVPRRERIDLARAYARLGGESAALALGERRRLLAGEVRRLWYELAVQRARRDSARHSVELQADLTRKLQGRRAAGEMGDAEWELLQLELTRAGHALAAAQAEVAAGEERLSRKLRLPSDHPCVFETGLDELLLRTLAPEDRLPLTRPEIALADLEVRRAEAALALARGQSRGDWSVGAGIDVERRSNDATGRLATEPRLSMTASAPWPGGPAANRGEILEREASLRIAEADLQARRDEIAAELGAAIAAVRASQPAVRNYRALLLSAEDLPRKLAPAYARGEVSGLQMAQALQQRVAIESDFLAAVSRYLSLLAEAETAAGLIPSLP